MNSRAERWTILLFIQVETQLDLSSSTADQQSWATTADQGFWPVSWLDPPPILVRTTADLVQWLKKQTRLGYYLINDLGLFNSWLGLWNKACSMAFQYIGLWANNSWSDQLLWVKWRQWHLLSWHKKTTIDFTLHSSDMKGSRWHTNRHVVNTYSALTMPIEYNDCGRIKL